MSSRVSPRVAAASRYPRLEDSYPLPLFSTRPRASSRARHARAHRRTMLARADGVARASSLALATRSRRDFPTTTRSTMRARRAPAARATRAIRARGDAGTRGARTSRRARRARGALGDAAGDATAEREGDAAGAVRLGRRVGPADERRSAGERGVADAAAGDAAGRAMGDERGRGVRFGDCRVRTGGADGGGRGEQARIARGVDGSVAARAVDE